MTKLCVLQHSRLAVTIGRASEESEKQKNRGPTRPPIALPPDSGSGATKPAHPGIRDSRVSIVHAQCHRSLYIEVCISGFDCGS
jgi:hypothetical protein